MTFAAFGGAVVPHTLLTSNKLTGHPGKQLLWITTVMVQGTYGPLQSHYGPLQLWSSTQKGHILNELKVHIGS